MDNENKIKVKGSGKLNILVVEDDHDVWEILQAKIQDIDMLASHAPNGEIGQIMALSGKYDLVISDMDMPVKSGLRMVRDLRDRDFTNPIIMYTSGKDYILPIQKEVGFTVAFAKMEVRQMFAWIQANVTKGAF